MGYPNVSERRVCVGLASTAMLAHVSGNRKNWVEIHKALVKLQDGEINAFIKK